MSEPFGPRPKTQKPNNILLTQALWKIDASGPRKTNCFLILCRIGWMEINWEKIREKNKFVCCLVGGEGGENF